MKRVRSRWLLLTLCGLAAGRAGAQQGPRTDTLALQRLLVAEDARGTGADGVAPLLDGLASTDTLLRRVAVRGVGRLQRPDLAPRLLGLLADPTAAVRAEAANAAAQLLATVSRGAPPSDPARLSVMTAQQRLLEALAAERDAAVVEALAEALGRLRYGDSATARIVERALVARADGVPNLGVVRGLYWLATARRMTGAPAQPAIELLRRGAVAAPDTATRRVSLMALAAAAALDSATVLGASGDGDAQVRRLALAGAASLSPSARAVLVRRAFADASPIVRMAAVGAARAGTDRPACAPIIAATNDKSAYVAQIAIDALGLPRADSARAATALAAIVARPVADPVPDHRWQRPAHALEALARIDSARAAAAIDRYATAARWEERAAAANAAGKARIIPVLRRLADDADANVREAAVAGLAATVGHAADTVYLAALHAPGHQTVLAAAAALAGSPHPAALPNLLDAFDRLSAPRSENARDPRLAVLKRIAELGSEASSTRLTPYLADFDTTVATTVASMLSTWSGQTVVARAAPLPIRPEPLARVLLARTIRARVTMAASSGGGTFTVRLLADEVPATVARVVRLARARYYDGHVLQRVEPNFVIQGGGPGASEYVGDDAFMRDELGQRSHARGTLGISTRGRDTGDAQWFVNLVDNTRLDHEYTVFGDIVTGRDVVERILEGDRIGRVEILDAP